MKRNRSLVRTAVVVPVFMLAAVGVSIPYYSRAATDSVASIERPVGDKDGAKRGHGPWRDAIREGFADRAALEATLEARDFDAFKELIEGAPFADTVDRETFDQLVEAHELAQAGDFDGAKEVLMSVGIHHAHQWGLGGPGVRALGNKEAREAVENNDYEAWVDAMDDYPNQDALTEDTFDLLVEADDLIDANDPEAGRALLRKVREALHANK